MTYQTVNYEVRNRTAFVTLNRPDKGNALNEKMHEELHTIWHRINDDDDVWSAVLQGSGPDFCLGEDVDEIANAIRQGTKVKRWIEEQHLQSRYSGANQLRVGWPEPMWGLPSKPLVAKVHGRCHGAGLLMVAHSDFAIATDDASFSLPNVHQGMAPIQEVIALTRTLVRGPALRLALMGKSDSWTAERARQLGLLLETHPATSIQTRLDEIIDIINNRSSTLAIRGAKAGIWSTINLNYENAQRRSHAYLNQVRFGTEDAKEGPKAFVEKRQPRWQGQWRDQ